MMVRYGSIVLMLLAAPVHADEVGDLLRDIRAVSNEAGGAAKARMAWAKLVRHGPEALPRILAAMDTPDTVAANWLRTAFDRIAADSLEKKRPLDVEPLRGFAADVKRQGRARRLALDLVEQLKPGSRAALLRDAINDPEFRYEAIEQTAEEITKRNLLAGQARPHYLQLFEASRDLEQGRRLALSLNARGPQVSLAKHLGFLRQWHVIGPFDGKNMKGFHIEYPPEKSVDLKGTLDGKGGKKLSWKQLEVPETWTGRHQALVDLHAALGAADDAVGYAHTSIRVREGGEFELRGAADDNFTVWVNGKRVFGFEEYRNGVRLDRHRFKVRLTPGVNRILVKVCQGVQDETHREPNWEFLLRLCDETGKGIPFTGGEQ